MPTDFATPALSDTYTNFLTYLKARDVDIALWFDNTGTLNVPTDAKGWDDTGKKFIIYNGSAWVDLATQFNINVQKLQTFQPGNASGNIPVSNGVKNVNLNADTLDGATSGTGAGNLLLLDGSGLAPSSILPASGVTAGTFRSVTVDAKGRVTAGTLPTTRAGYGITDVPTINGTSATGTWSIDINGNATTATTATTAGKWTTARNLTMTGQVLGTVSIDGSANASLSAQLAFGAYSTSGTTDWNDVSNTAAGFSTTLLQGSATNGPGPASYYHCMVMEYNTKAGAGNLTQVAVPYNNASNSNWYYRTRASGVWSSWITKVTSANIGTFAPSLTGTGASGTWTISVSGNAGTATLATNATHANKAGGLDSGITTDGAITVNGQLNISTTHALSFSAYGGGWFMVDTTWVRVQNDKSVYTAGNIRSDGQLQAGGSGQFVATAAGAVSAAGNITAGGKLFGNGGTRGYGKITLTTTAGTPTGGADGDFVFVYA